MRSLRKYLTKELNIENFEKPKKSKFSKKDFDEFPSENRGKSKSSIENCINYVTFHMQFSICLTAKERNLNNAVINMNSDLNYYEVL